MVAYGYGGKKVEVNSLMEVWR